VKKHVNHDGDWRMINKDLATMNHTSKKGKQECWRWGTGCDVEEQVDVWVWYINQAIKSHMIIGVDIYWIEETKVTWTRRQVMIIYDEEIHYHRLKVKMLKSRSCWDPQVLTKMKSGKKKNQVDKLKFILNCFISFLSTGRRTMKRDATWSSWQN
jgi:hypothetical protein